MPDPRPHTKAAYKAALETIAGARGGEWSALVARNALAGRHHRDFGWKTERTDQGLERTYIASCDGAALALPSSDVPNGDPS